MSGNPPKLPPGISLQRTQAAPAPNLPPGISIQRSGENNLQNLPSGIQVQRSSDTSGMDRLAGLGIQVSRPAPDKNRNNDMDRLSRLGISVSSSGREGSPSPPVNRSPAHVPDRLSSLGVSVSGGPRAPPNLPPGMSITGGPKPQGNGPRLPPGVNISGGPRTSQNLPPGMSISGGPRPQVNAQSNVPPGINISGGPRQNLPPGVNISGGPNLQQSSGQRSNLPPNVQVGNAPRPNLSPKVQVGSGLRPNLPPQAGSGPRPNLPPQAGSGPRPNLPPQGGSGPRPNLSPQVGSGPRPNLSPQIGSGQRHNLPPGVNISGGPHSQLEQRSSPKPGSPHVQPGLQPSDRTDVQSPSVNKNSENDTDHGNNEAQDSSGQEEPKENGKVTPVSEKDEDESDKENDDVDDEEDKEAEGTEAKEDEEGGKKSEDAVEQETVGESGEKQSTEPVEKGKDEKENAGESGEKSKGDGKEKSSESADTSNGNGTEEGWEGYEGEEGWEGYEGEEGWEGYEGEEGWEEYEEGGEGEAKQKTDSSEKKEESSDKASKEDANEQEKEEGEIEQGEKANVSKSSEENDEEFDEVMEEDDNASSVSKDTDGAPKDSGEKGSDSVRTVQDPGKSIGGLGNISISRLSKDDDEVSETPPGKKLPPGISMSSVPSLPPGISISSQGASGPTSSLPPGISISPFKKPSASTRQSFDDDTRSVNSLDRDNSFSREDSEALSVRSYSEHKEDPTPQVGTDTICVFCFNRCSERSPKLLTCLHTACGQCFNEKIRISIRDNSANDVVDLDGDDIQMAPEVTCSICKASTSEDEVIDNYFAAADDDDDYDKGADNQHICVSCEEHAIATSKCSDCDEYLCNDCVRAHQRVKMTKDHEITMVASSGNLSSNINYCDVHNNEKLTLYCESCDTLNCRDCQLSERHRNHKYRYSYEVAPEIKATFMQSVSDIRLKKNGLEESRELLSSKISEVNSKENSLLSQLREVKSYLISKIENRHRDLVTEVTKLCREKRKLLEGRKSNLDRTYWQADNAIAFVKNVLEGNVSDEKMLLTKKIMSRQMKRLRRANNSVNLTPADMEMKLDMYFQHFTGQALHSNLDSVLKMIMSDIKVSTVPIEAPKPKPPPPPPASPVRQAPSTPTRAVPASPQGVPRSSPARLNTGMVNRQLGTPQKQIVARSPGAMRQKSPSQPMMNQQGRNMQGARMQVMQQPRMNQPNRGGRGRGQMVQQGVRMGASPGNRPGMMGGRGQQVMGQQNRGRATARGGMMNNQGMVRGGNQQMASRGRGANRGGQLAIRGPQPQVNRGGMQMNRGGMQQQGRGAGMQQIRGGGMQQPRMIKPAGGRGRPAGQGNMMVNQNNQYTKAATGAIQIQPITYQPQRGGIQKPQPQTMVVNTNQRPGKPVIANLSTSPGSSWHTPTTANRPVSPPHSADVSSFKIKLPKMGEPTMNVKKENSPDILGFDGDLPAKIVKPNGASNVNDALATLNRTGIQISRQDDGVDPLGADPVKVVENEGTPHGDLETRRDIKSETVMGSTAKTISQPSMRPVMEGSDKKEKADGDWCAVCHDGGDTLYCCDRCPKVYHLFCYVPPLTAEPADDWVCLMCSTIDEILSLPTKVKKGRGNLSERDLKLCRRLLFEMYNLWPESVPFRDCADLNFPQYLEKIKDPIALDVIKERLDEENPDQYLSVRAFLADLRKMFRNCFLFNSKESEIYRHAKKLEEKLDQLLQMWLPEFAFDPLTDLVDNTKGAKRPLSPQPGPSKKKRSNESATDYMGKKKDKKKKKKRKKRNRDSDDNRSDSDSDDISEVELL